MKWRRFLQKIFIAAALAFLIAVVPMPLWTPEWLLYWQVPAVVFIFVCYLGKLIIDRIVYPGRD
jgi:NADH:ubiquinone oxidoreductase subunit 2 (subunit N)